MARSQPARESVAVSRAGKKTAGKTADAKSRSRRKTQGSRLTKGEFVDQVANSSGLGKSEAGKAVDAVLSVIEETLSRGGEVNFTGFGKFTVAERGARQGVNPQTGERIQIAASKVPRFSAGSALKTAVKSGA